MKRWRAKVCFLTAVGLACLLAPPTVHAYLDPGTGSYVLQLLIAALLAAVVTVKIYWGRIKAFVSGLFSRKSRDEPDPD